jgi:hypothetical protein
MMKSASNDRAPRTTLVCLLAVLLASGAAGCGGASHQTVEQTSGGKEAGLAQLTTGEEAEAKKSAAEASKREAAEEAEIKKSNEALRKDEEAEEAQQAAKKNSRTGPRAGRATRSRGAVHPRNTSKHKDKAGRKQSEASKTEADRRREESAARRRVSGEEAAEVKAFEKLERQEAAVKN